MVSKIKGEEITGRIIRGFYRVYNTLGYGFLEKVYRNALAIELGKFDLKVVSEQPINVYYDGQRVGDYYADMVINDSVIIELKVAESIHTAHEAQLLNYLKSTEIELGLILSFGPKPTFSRKLFTNDRKRLSPD